MRARTEQQIECIEHGQVEQIVPGRIQQRDHDVRQQCIVNNRHKRDKCAEWRKHARAHGKKVGCFIHAFGFFVDEHVASVRGDATRLFSAARVWRN
jgi:hypothetical protein